MADKVLVVELSSERVKFTQFIGEHIEFAKHHHFKGFSETEYKEQLLLFINDNNINFAELDEVVVSWGSKETSLVPSAVFAESSPEAIYKLCFHVDIPPQQVDYNRIPELQLVNVFDVPLWVKSFFVLKFPRVTIQHEGTHLLRAIFAGSTFKTSCYVLMHKEYFTLIIVKENNLIFYSIFEYQTAEDVAYYLSYTLQQKELTASVAEIQVMSGALDDQIVCDQFKTVFSNLPQFKKVQLKIDDSLPTKYIRKCV